MLTLEDVFIFCVVLWFIIWWKKKSSWDLAEKIPGSSGLPLIGIIYKFIGVKAEGEKEQIFLTF